MGFQTLLDNKKPFVVAFMAQFCGFCTIIKPEYVEAAKKSQIPFYTMYSSQPGASSVLNKYNIGGFPTVLKFKNGQKVEEYNGVRKADSIAMWANQ